MVCWDKLTIKMNIASNIYIKIFKFILNDTYYLYLIVYSVFEYYIIIKVNNFYFYNYLYK